MSSTLPLPVVTPLGTGFWCDLFDLKPATNFADATKDLKVTIKLVTGGSIATVLTAWAIPYTISLFYESFGDAPEGEVLDAAGATPVHHGTLDIGCVPSVYDIYNGDPNAWDYDVSMPIPANTLQKGQTYKLTAVLQSAGLMNAFIESEMFSTMP